jgi:hydroxymethylglutaryl-CoA lyase
MGAIDVRLREVGMRDGLQSVDQVMATPSKNSWCSQEAASGMPEIEVCSFVPPKLIPQFHDAAEVVAHALTVEGLTVSALVPNVKGAERALAAGVHKINFVMSVSESHNQANVRKTVDESLEELKRVVALLGTLEREKRPRLSGGLGTAFGYTLEGAIDEGRVVELARRLAEAGVDEVVVADTVGYGNPAAVRRVFGAVRQAVPGLPVAAHFHDTRGLGLANVVAALDAGVREFDASLGGFGGCPYAPGATGNVTMEDLVFLLEAMGLRSGVDVARLIEVRRFVEAALPGVAFAGTIAHAGLPKNFVPAQERNPSSKVA